MRLLVLIALTLMLAACGGGGYDPASIQPTFQARNTPVPTPTPKYKPNFKTVQDRARTRAGGRIQVQAGQTLYAISRAYGVPLRDLISVNGLRAPYSLAIGQTLRLPSARVHTVKRGDTAYSISRRYGVTLSGLMRVNDIRAPYTLSVGQKLRLPGGAAPTASVSGSSAATPNGVGSARPQATPPRRGRSVAITQPPPRTSARFAWPTRGQIASRFGPKEGGQYNEGINILASQGSPVRAAEAGVVAYASNQLAGYGNLLLIRHADGFVSAYAHNERILVRTGQQVRRGDVVARVGKSGGVREPQLHFEIRKGRRALDPLDYLEQRTASARLSQ